MIFKELKSNKGSTLGLVLITLSVLSLLGVTLISVGLASYKIRMTEERIKTSFYMAESGLEQAYGIILEAVGEAVGVANDEVNDAIESFIDSEREKERLGIDDPGNPDDNDSDYIHNDPDGTINPDGPVNEAKINEAKTKLLAEGGYGWLGIFQNTFVGHINDIGLDSRLVNDDSNQGRYKIIHPAETWPVIGLDSYASFATYPHDKYTITLQSSFDFEGTTQTVQMEFVINEPTTIIAGDFTETHVVQIPKSPIWDNALVADDNIKISGGDVTIRGDVFANAAESRPSYALPVNSASIGGLVIDPASAGAEVKIRGNVFTNSFVQVRSNNPLLTITGDTFANSLVMQKDTVGSTINLTGNLYTSDDIELNGTQATIDIDGNFYGFSKGHRHDESGSIVINSSDINISGGSSIKIHGDSVLAGVAHVELTDILYQTGESVSLRGNFKAYSVPLGLPLTWYDPFALISYSLTYPPLTPLTVFQKANHFYKVSDPSESGLPSNFLDVGHSENSKHSIEIAGNIASLGAFINRGEIYDSNVLGANWDGFLNALSEHKEQFDGNLLSQYNYSRIFGHTVPIESPPAGGLGNPDNLENEIVYITASDVALIGNGGTDLGIETVPNKTIMPDGQTVLTGIIITDGNVHIRGEITFRGLIAAKGNIYIEDNHPKLFRTDLGFILRKVHENLAIAAVFSGVQSGETLTFTALSQAGAADPETLAQYKGLIEVSSWERIN